MLFFKPEVLKCTVDLCSFNKNETCRAGSISIGGPHQECDTFEKAGSKVADNNGTGNVGTCNVPGCNFNDKTRCQAQGVNVAVHADHADCTTYSERT